MFQILNCPVSECDKQIDDVRCHYTPKLTKTDPRRFQCNLSIDRHEDMLTKSVSAFMHSQTITFIQNVTKKAEFCSNVLVLGI